MQAARRGRPTGEPRPLRRARENPKQRPTNDALEIAAHRHHDVRALGHAALLQRRGRERLASRSEEGQRAVEGQRAAAAAMARRRVRGGGGGRGGGGWLLSDVEETRWRREGHSECSTRFRPKRGRGGQTQSALDARFVASSDGRSSSAARTASGERAPPKRGAKRAPPETRGRKEDARTRRDKQEDAAGPRAARLDEAVDVVVVQPRVVHPRHRRRVADVPVEAGRAVVVAAVLARQAPEHLAAPRRRDVPPCAA